MAGDIKLVGVADTPGGCAAMQNNLNRLEKWADRNLTQFSKGQCKDLHQGRNSSRRQSILGAVWLEISFTRKVLGVLLDGKLTMSLQCAFIKRRANGILGYIRRNIASRLKEVVLPVSTVLVRPHLEYCVQFWAPHCKREMELQERLQRKGLEHLSCEERPRELGPLLGQAIGSMGALKELQSMAQCPGGDQ